jgi:hypothetical protein
MEHIVKHSVRSSSYPLAQPVYGCVETTHSSMIVFIARLARVGPLTNQTIPHNLEYFLVEVKLAHPEPELAPTQPLPHPFTSPGLDVSTDLQ